MTKRILPTLLAVLAVTGGVLAYGWYQRQQGELHAAQAAERRVARDLVASNQRWIAQLAAVRDSVSRETSTADSAVRRADTVRVIREALPTPEPDAPDTAVITYWRTRAELAEQENRDLRVAFAAQQQATARLQAALERTAAQLDSTTNALDQSLDREEPERWLGFIPKPSSEVAFAAGVIVTVVAMGRQ